MNHMYVHVGMFHTTSYKLQWVYTCTCMVAKEHGMLQIRVSYIINYIIILILH